METNTTMGKIEALAGCLLYVFLYPGREEKKVNSRIFGSPSTSVVPRPRMDFNI